MARLHDRDRIGLLEVLLSFLLAVLIATLALA